jgi:protein ImuB
MLWVALEMPALPLQIVERAGVCAEPLVVSEGPAQRPFVACANAAAREAGIREGQAVAAARALAAELRVVPRDPRIEQETLERIAAWAGQFTPMVSLDRGRIDLRPDLSPTGVVLEIESTLRLFDGHAKMTAAILRGARDLGFNATLGIAPTPLAARLFARAEAQGRAVRACLSLAELPDRVAELPLFLLDWPEKTLARLTDLGVLRVRDMLDLPAEGVARRFGPEIALSLDRLMGRVPDPREPYAPPARFRSRLELPAEADGVEALLFPLKRLLAELEGALRARGAGVQRLTLVLEQERRARTRLDLDFTSPEREADFILAIAREKLGRLTLAAPTIAMSLRADALLACLPRNAAWLPGAQEQAIGRERLIQRLAARLGRNRVFGIALADDHRPERGWKPGTDPSFHGAEQKGQIRQRPIWLLQRAQRLVTAEGNPCLQGPLALVAGPERIESGWWDGDEVTRDYYVARNPHGETYWVYREHRDPGAWYVHGVFA